MKEPNIMGHYHGKNSSNYRILEFIRELYVRGHQDGFDSSFCELLSNEVSANDINSSKLENHLIRSKIDKPRFEIYQAAKTHYFPREKRDMLLLVNGTYVHYTGREYKTTNIHSLGTNPYTIFQSSESMDNAITDQTTLNHLQEHFAHLTKDMRFTHFIIDSSHFFYVPRKLNDYFHGTCEHYDGKNLVPFLYGNSKFVQTTPIELPSLELYRKHFFSFISSRHKLSPVTKMMRKLNDKKILSLDEIICDWVAFRVVLKDRKLVDMAHNNLLSHPNFPNGITIDKVMPKNYFDAPKGGPRGFEAYVDNVFFRFKGEIVPIEIQFQIRDNYHRFEIEQNPNDSTTRERKNLRTEDEEISKNKDKKLSKSEQESFDNLTKLNGCVRTILEEMYGQSKTIIKLDKKKGAIILNRGLII